MGGRDVPDAHSGRGSGSGLQTIVAVPDGMCAAFVVHGGVIMAVLESFARPKRDFYAYHIGNGECLACTYDGQVLRVKSIAR